ncbi:MAG: amidophosphoribosyltransferase [Nitrososphaerales archaeon]
MKEACGVVVAHSERGVDVVPKILRTLEALQHRGQESWGFAVPNRPVFKRLGLVAEWKEHEDEVAGYSGNTGIGHVRYSTKGRTSVNNAHPIQIGQEFSIAHNGTIVNVEGIATSVSREPGSVSCESDTRVVGLRLLQLLREGNDWFSSFEKLGKELIGAYCFAILNRQGDAFAVRDPRGYRPLSLGWHERSSTHIVASESCALSAVEAELVRDIEPGEMVMMGHGGKLESFRFAPKMDSAFCSFEYAYFAHPSSRVNGVSVYETRKKLGKILAKKLRAQGDVIVPVPDSARPAALGFSLVSGIPMDEGLMKDRYKRRGSIRSFIEPRQESREEVVKQIIPIKEVVDGKDVIVVDDSVVRGTSARTLIRSLKRSGAKSVKMAVTFPPIRHPCRMGIDFPTREELLAHRVAEDEAEPEELAAKVGSALDAEEFYYNDIDGMSEAIGIPKEKLCFACVDGDYSKLEAILPLQTEERRKVDP